MDANQPTEITEVAKSLYLVCVNNSYLEVTGKCGMVLMVTVSHIGASAWKLGRLLLAAALTARKLPPPTLHSMCNFGVNALGQQCLTPCTHHVA
jgi:hypothetical protein